MAGQVGIPALLCYQAYGFPVDKLDYYNLPFRYEEILYIEAYSTIRRMEGWIPGSLKLK